MTFAPVPFAVRTFATSLPVIWALPPTVRFSIEISRSRFWPSSVAQPVDRLKATVLTQFRSWTSVSIPSPPS